MFCTCRDMRVTLRTRRKAVTRKEAQNYTQDIDSLSRLDRNCYVSIQHTCTIAGRVFAGLLILAASLSASAATYHVNQDHPAATDSNPGSATLPWSTIQKAANTVQAGDTVLVAPGVYEERVTLPGTLDGTAGNTVEFRAEPRRQATVWGFSILNSDYIRIEGFDITIPDALRSSDWTATYAVFIGGNYVEVVDNYFHDIAGIGVSGLWSKSPWAQGGYIANNKMYKVGSGIHIFGSDWVVENNEIERLIWRNIGQDADYTRGFGSNIVIRRNYFHGTLPSEIGSAHVDGFQTFSNNNYHAYDIVIEGNIIGDFHEGVIIGDPIGIGTIHDITVRNNVFFGGNLGGAWGTLFDHHVYNILVHHNLYTDIDLYGVGSRDFGSGVVKNNIFFGVSHPYYTDTGGTMDADYNLFFNAPETDLSPNDIIGSDPLFLNPQNVVGVDGLPFTADDGYRLQVGSGAIDRGTSLGVLADILGTARPQGTAHDVGPFEFVLQSTDTTPPNITLLGANPVTLVVGDPYTDAGATAWDDVDGDLTNAITVDNPVNTAVAGSYTVTYGVTDGAGNFAETTRLVHVQTIVINHPPNLDPIGPQSVAEGATLTLEVHASDSDGTTPSLHASNLPDAATFTDHGNGSASFSWTPGYEAATGQDYLIVFEARDEQSGVSESVSVSVSNVNRAPVLAAIGNREVNEGALLNITISATDPDADSLSFSADYASVPEPNDAIFSDNGDGTANFSWTPTSEHSGQYAIVFRATDSGTPALSDEQGVSITVVDVHSAPRTIYVDANSTDETQDGSAAHPYRTMSAAMNQVEASRGDSVIVKPGVYAEDIVVKNGTTLTSAEGAYHTIILGSAQTSPIVTCFNDVKVCGFTIGTEDASAAIFVTGSGVSLTNSVLFDSLCGIQVQAEGEIAVANIAVSNCADAGFRTEAGAGSCTVYNSVFVENAVGISAGEPGSVASNYNTFHNNDQDYVAVAPGATDFVGDPRFVDPGMLNYHLRADSPCRDSGEPNEAWNDVDGSRCDVGPDGGPSGRVDTQNPTVVLHVDPDTGLAPLEVFLDASNSTDEWGIASITWDLDARSRYKAALSGPTQTFTYGMEGTYLLTVTVTDNSGLFTQASRLIQVGSGLPTASASAYPLAGPAPLSVQLEGSGEDPRGGALSYTWDFDQDGQVDSMEQSPALLLPAGTLPGSYMFVLTVMTADNRSSQAMIPVTVTSGDVLAAQFAPVNEPAVLEVTDLGSPWWSLSAEKPAGAFQNDVVFAMSEVADPPAPPVSGDTIFVAVGPENVRLSAPITLQVPIAEQNPLTLDRIEVQWYDAVADSWSSTGITSRTLELEPAPLVVFESDRTGIFAVTVLPQSSKYLRVPKIKIRSKSTKTADTKLVARVFVRDDNDAPLAGAQVEIEWTRPDKSAARRAVTTNSKGIARSTLKAEPGQYTISVIRVEMDGYILDESNSVLVATKRLAP